MPSPEKFRQAVSVMNESLAGEQVTDILEAKPCVFKYGFREE